MKGYTKDPITGLPLLKPGLKLIGSKSDSRPYIYQQFPEKYDAYVEPFLGSGTVWCGIEDNPNRVELLSDINPYVINFFQILQDNPEDFWSLLQTELGFFLEAEKESLAEAYKFFYAIRDSLTTTESPLFRAVYFYMVTKSCVNGIFRTNKTGKCNSSFSKDVRTRGWYTREWFDAVVKRAYFAIFECIDYKATIQQIKWDTTFLFLDPPYEYKSKKNPKGTCTTYNGIRFLEKDFLELEELLRQTPAKWLMTVSDTELMRQIFKNYDILSWDVYYRASSNGKTRGLKPELLIGNYELKR